MVTFGNIETTKKCNFTPYKKRSLSGASPCRKSSEIIALNAQRIIVKEKFHLSKNSLCVTSCS